jgi:hypothetical protein
LFGVAPAAWIEMPGTIEFTFDADNDVVIARPKWSISTPEDCETWFAEWTSYLSSFGRKIDCIIVLDDFFVDEGIATLWGEYRARLTNEYHRFSCRVHSNWDVRTYVLSSGARFGVAANEAESVEAALDSIRKARERAGVPRQPESAREPARR